ncbi:MAG TPA: carbohydrate kinase family protein [Anaerolineaceae bacterium]|nr:carbohydrate kinase family protein [Anaerolineaceae bacterium]HBA91957.1 carbohydrate kinase family protein [Anaerolineaceae bacterium]
MASILVSGLINIETTLRIAEFPLAYNPVHYPFNGIESSVSGVGYNLAKALTRLGNPVEFLSLIGRNDYAADLVRAALVQDGIPDSFVLSQVDQTAQSVILFDPSGKRQIHVDLKDIQEQFFPPKLFEAAAQKCDILALCNINFSRAMLKPARASGKLVATDVHAIGSLDDAYNQDFMAAAHILFMSHENLPLPPEEWARAVQARFSSDIVVIGLGAEGCLLAVRRDGFIGRIPAVYTGPVVNTIGAGDALFSAFLHAYRNHHDPYRALRSAVVFASYKIGAVSAADGFLSAAELENWSRKIYGDKLI